MQKNPFKAYQTTQVTTARPEKILLMLYEGAIKFNKMAIQKMREKNVAEKGKYISKTLAIIAELMNTLDHEVGGQLADDLEGLYMFMMDKLIDANVKNDVESLLVVERLMKTLLSAWQDVVDNPRADGVPSPVLQPDLFQTYHQAVNGAQNTNGLSAAKRNAPNANGSTIAPPMRVPNAVPLSANSSNNAMASGANNPLKIVVPPRK